jgi:hypothetical protein
MRGPTVRTLLLRCMLRCWSSSALLLLMNLPLWISIVVRPASAFVTTTTSFSMMRTKPTSRIRTCNIGGNVSKEDDDSNEDLNLESLKSIPIPSADETIDGQPLTAAVDNAEPALRTSTVRIDDGGSDLTDRFKYKVSPYGE